MDLSKGLLIEDNKLAEIRDQFYYVEKDINGNERVYFDNSGGSFRLKKAAEAFWQVDSIPDCSERKNNMAAYLQEIEEKGKSDIRVIFNAAEGAGAIATFLTASQAAFRLVGTVAENASGSNMVTTKLEHPSIYDAIAYYADKTKKDMRVAGSNINTGGVDVDEIIKLVDKDTCLLTVMYASNVTGAIFDIEAIVKKARAISPDIYIIVDAVQHTPHGRIDLEKTPVDAISFAPYKFFGVRGLGVAYLSERLSNLKHPKLLGKDNADWEVGSPAPAHYAAVTEIVNYVCTLADNADQGKSRRELFAEGMNCIALQERALLQLLLEGTDKNIGLRHMKNVKVHMDNPDLTARDLIIGIELVNMECNIAVKEYEKRGVIVCERSSGDIYSGRMLLSFHVKGVVRISPLHCNSVDDINKFLAVTQEISNL